jgi:DNA replication protein DnaC
MMSHPLYPKLRQLKLSGMLQTLDLRVSQTIDQHLAPLEFLALLLDDELERRRQQSQLIRLAQSGCDSNKTLAHFDFLAAPGINRSLIQDLASCLFIQRHENLLMCGPTGVGKSHLANALAIEAIKHNFKVIAKTTHRLLNDLQVSRANGSFPRMMSRILNCDLLVLDDFGLQAVSPQGAQDLYAIISERYEQGSIIITSNRSFEEWGDVFANDLLSSAALDRLTHHAHTIIIRGDSFRQRNRLIHSPVAGKEPINSEIPLDSN